jgi:hypothetical protein
VSLAPLAIGPGPEDGTHRLTVEIASPSDRWPEVARHLAQDLEDMERAAAWSPGTHLDLVGWSATPLECRFYLAGSALFWVALTAGGLSVPLLRHMSIVLGQQPVALRLDRRTLSPATYDQITGRGWPFRIAGPLHAVRVTISAPDLTEGQLRGLVEMLTPALRRAAWEEGSLPDEARPTLEGAVLVLPEPLRAGALLEVVHVWAQVFWVELQGVSWTM